MIKLPDFILIPYQLLEDKNISLIDERLYGIIYWFTKLKNEKCTASNIVLAQLVKSSPQTIANSLNKMDEMGYIQRLFLDTSKRHRKEIIPLVVFSKVTPTDVSSDVDTPTSVSDTPTSVSVIHPPVYLDTLTSEQNKNTNKNTNKNNKEELPDWLNKEIWSIWVSYRKENRKPLTSHTIKLQLRELEKDKSNHIAILEQSIKNSWSGLFPLKGEKKNNILKAKDNKYDRFN